MTTRLVPFTDLLSAIVDNRGRTCPTASTGTALIATNCVKNDALFPVKEKLRYVNDETYATWFRGHPMPGDILFVCKGSPGNVAMVPDPVDFCIAQDMVAVRADPAKIYPRFLFAALRSRNVQSQIAAMHVGTLIPHFKKGDFHNLLIPLPSSDDQRHIGDVYVAFSMKMEANRRIAVLSDALIRAKLEAAVGESAVRVPVSTLATFVNGGAYTKGASGTGRLVIRIAELNSGPGESTVYSDLVPPDNQLARPGDLLMSWSGSLDVYRWTREEAIINQHIFKVIPTTYPHWLVYSGLKRAMGAFRDIAADKATTMGHIKRHHLEDVDVEIPSSPTMAQLDAPVEALWRRALLAETETLTLEKLRDTLLADLLSGRLSTQDKRHLTEAVT